MWENPQSSLQWFTPQAQHIQTWPGILDVLVHTCAYGARWKKPLLFRCWGISGASSLQRVCQSNTHVCVHTLLPHIQLRGCTPHGINWTKLAHSYPVELCRAIANLLSDTGYSKVFAFVASAHDQKQDRNATLGA
eukprot:6461121-Amphidinium_carterae.1